LIPKEKAMKKFSTHPMFELPDGESYILNCHPNDMLKFHDMAEDIRLTKLCYINICSNSGLYKRPIYDRRNVSPTGVVSKAIATSHKVGVHCIDHHMTWCDDYGSI
jgi:hypothetical protein